MKRVSMPPPRTASLQKKPRQSKRLVPAKLPSVRRRRLGLDEPDGLTQITGEAGKGFAPLGLAAHSQDRGRVDGRKPGATVRPPQQPAALARQDERSAHQRERGGRAESHHELGLQHVELEIEPPPTGLNLAAVRSLVKTSFAARLVLEVLDRVGEIDRSAVQPDFGQRAVEHLARGSDKWPAGDILLVAGLLAGHHHRRGRGTLSKYRLRRVEIKGAAGATGRLFADVGKTICHLEAVSGGAGWLRRRRNMAQFAAPAEWRN